MAQYASNPLCHYNPFTFLLVGASGSGKSMLTKTICQLFNIKPFVISLSRLSAIPLNHIPFEIMNMVDLFLSLQSPALC